MNFDVLNPPVIQVDLSVSRCDPFPQDGIAQVWGFVGDYEVAIWLPLDDQRVISCFSLALIGLES